MLQREKSQGEGRGGGGSDAELGKKAVGFTRSGWAESASEVWVTGEAQFLELGVRDDRADERRGKVPEVNLCYVEAFERKRQLDEFNELVGGRF